MHGNLDHGTAMFDSSRLCMMIVLISLRFLNGDYTWTQTNKCNRSMNISCFDCVWRPITDIAYLSHNLPKTDGRFVRQKSKVQYSSSIRSWIMGNIHQYYYGISSVLPLLNQWRKWQTGRSRVNPRSKFWTWIVTWPFWHDATLLEMGALIPVHTAPV